MNSDKDANNITINAFPGVTTPTKKFIRIKNRISSHCMACDVEYYTETCNTCIVKKDRDHAIKIIMELQETMKDKFNVPNDMFGGIIVNNISDPIDVLSYINKNYYVLFNKETNKYLIEIQHCIDLINNEKLFPSSSSKYLIELVEKQHSHIINNVSSVIEVYVDKLIDLLLFSNIHKNHMIFIQTRDHNEKFYIHDHNKWSKNGDTTFLKNYSDKFLKYFIDGYIKAGFEDSANLIKYVYEKNSINIIETMSKRIYYLAFKSRGKLMNIFKK